MKKVIASVTIGALLAAALVPLAFAAEKPAGQVDFGTFTKPSKGGPFVEVNLSSGMLSMAAGLARSEPEVADLLKGILGVRVKVIGLDEDNRAQIGQRMTEIQSTLEKENWDKIVTASQKNQDVNVFMKTQGSDIIQGVVVLVQEAGKQAVFVNVVGDIKPEKLGLLGEKFGIDPLKNLGGVKKHAKKAPKEEKGLKED